MKGSALGLPHNAATLFLLLLHETHMAHGKGNAETNIAPSRDESSSPRRSFSCDSHLNASPPGVAAEAGILAGYPCRGFLATEQLRPIEKKSSPDRGGALRVPAVSRFRKRPLRKVCVSTGR